MSTAVTPVSFDPAIFSNEDVVGLRRTICAEPKENTHRLVLADKLEELGCGEWAELVRVQMELMTSHFHDGEMEDTKNWQDFVDGIRVWPNEDRRIRVTHLVGLHTRESVLLTALTPRLRRGAKCERCGGSGKSDAEQWVKYAPASGGLKCGDCHGTGWSGTLDESGIMVRNDWGPGAAPTVTGVDWLVPAKFVRGMIGGITCLWDWWTDNGVACVEEWPIESLQFEDKSPSRYPAEERLDYGMPGSYGWFRGLRSGRLQERLSIPCAVWDKMVEQSECDINGRWADFPSEEAANTALGEVMLGWARKEYPKIDHDQFPLMR